MRQRLFLTLAAVVVAFQLGGEMVYAQTAQKITAEIVFPFVAGDEDMPAGKYGIELTAGGPVMLTGPGGVRVILPVTTTLGRYDQDPASEFVFDKIDGRMVLSGIWRPKKDRLLVLATKGPHEHAVLGGSNPKK